MKYPAATKPANLPLREDARQMIVLDWANSVEAVHTYMGKPRSKDYLQAVERQATIANMLRTLFPTSVFDTLKTERDALIEARKAKRLAQTEAAKAKARLGSVRGTCKKAGVEVPAPRNLTVPAATAAKLRTPEGEGCEGLEELLKF